jgi:exopolysaccharide biosynthesis polyprenyl glycosylphosphotransferase
LPSLLAKGLVDDVIVVLPTSFHEDIVSIRASCREFGVTFRLAPDLYDLGVGRMEVDIVGGIPLVNLKSPDGSRIPAVLKRTLDLLIAVPLSILTAPLVAVLGLAIRLDSPGPMLHKGLRAGKNGVPFPCYKLRTMVVNADSLFKRDPHSQDLLFKEESDPRITRVGGALRKLSLDELPQLWNVVKGDMSIVGPRPMPMRDLAYYEPWQHRRFAVKPGITGLWQISGRSDLTFEEMVLLDLYLIDHWSLLLDIRIILKTGVVVLSVRGAC